MTTDTDSTHPDNADGEFNRALRDEDERIRRIRTIVDIACCGLATGRATPDGARSIMTDTRRKVLALAPGCEAQYDLIYAPRLRRFAREFGGVDLDAQE